MKNFAKILLVSAAAMLAPALSAAAGFDYSALLSPENFENVDTVCRNASGAEVFGIKFEKLSLVFGKSAFKVSVPQKVVIKNLELTVFAKNLTQAELEKTEYQRPLDFEINGLALTIYGKRNVMTLKASNARLYRENIIYLSQDALLEVGGKSAKLGSGASVELKGRMLIIRSRAAGNLGVKI